jgi:hypothetical protein
MSNPPSDAERTEVIQSSLEVINSITYPLQVWEPLLNKRKNPPTELRIRALPIIVCCLFDIAEAPQKHLFQHIERSRNWRGFLSHNLTVLANECRFAAEALVDLSYEDQIFLRLTRNRMVHGFLNGTTKAFQITKVVDRFGIGDICLTNIWAAEILGDQDMPSHELLNRKRLEEILERFELPFQKYLEQTKEHFIDTEILRINLEADHIIYIKQE